MKPKRVPPSLRALGSERFPPSVEIDGERYDLVRTFKHDFFAATALYERPDGRIVVKFSRRVPFLWLPMGWVGRLLAGREARAYRKLADLDVVPRFVGMCGRNAIAHEYIEGHPLRRGERVADDFFDRLGRALATIHSRQMAYVDLEKCENVLVGDDGKPYLVDFQISWHWPRAYGGGLPPARWLLRRLQEGDRYHLRKLQRRTRPDQLSAAELAGSYRRSFSVRLHHWLTAPLQMIRRGVLNRFDPKRESGERGADDE